MVFTQDIPGELRLISISASRDYSTQEHAAPGMLPQ
jgi:hypothetical protein